MDTIIFLDAAIWILAGLVALLLVVMLIKHISNVIVQLRYLNHEIQRADGADRQYYLRRRRRLWLYAVLFIANSEE